ncbi:hypothetical protein Bca4012_029172 [Brassica carinata]|uniref:Uncharacterized protein n=1 Tax=Brassica carinata TaxID=52824 RepID=A0A8X7RK86_BRACI|nr:hypothetical protein Bca52824_049379 [Brassica carinata]
MSSASSSVNNSPRARTNAHATSARSRWKGCSTDASCPCATRHLLTRPKHPVLRVEGSSQKEDNHHGPHNFNNFSYMNGFNTNPVQTPATGAGQKPSPGKGWKMFTTASKLTVGVVSNALFGLSIESLFA